MGAIRKKKGKKKAVFPTQREIYEDAYSQGFAKDKQVNHDQTLSEKVAELEKKSFDDSAELNSIRACLLVNFSEKAREESPNKNVCKSTDSIPKMLEDVLRHLTK